MIPIEVKRILALAAYTPTGEKKLRRTENLTPHQGGLPVERCWDVLRSNFWFVAFFLWGLPLGFYRNKFRRIVYQNKSWIINIKPYFWREIKGLSCNLYPANEEYIKFRNFYRFYLAVYSALFVL